jgi:hypothetical protein
VLAELAMGGSRFEVRVRWTPALAAAAGTTPDAQAGLQPGSSGAVAVEAADAAACCEEAGLYRMRTGGAGLDAAEFLFAAGPAEPLRPLSAVASGGESARVMLALKAAPALLLANGAAPPDALGDHTSSASAGSDGGGAGSSGGAGATQILVLDEVDSGVGSRLGQPIGRILRRMAASQGPPAAQILCVSHLPQVSRVAPQPAPCTPCAPLPAPRRQPSPAGAPPPHPPLPHLRRLPPTPTHTWLCARPSTQTSAW